MNKTTIGGIAYSYGRSDYETYDMAIRREWVMTNGLGGYSGSSIIDSPMRMHHGHLIASLHSPVRRYLVLSKLNESLTIGDITYPLHTTKYKDSMTEGYRQLQNFYYDIMPIYTYQVADCQVTKEVLLEHGKNNVMVHYSLETGSSEVKLNLTPCFNFRPHGDSSTKEDHNYVISVEDKSLKLKPDSENVTISYRISQGNFQARDHVYDEDNYYDFEFQTGMEGIDTHYCPYNHRLQVGPFSKTEFYIQCEIIKDEDSSSLSDTDNLEDYYQSMLSRHIGRSKQMVAKAETTDPLAMRLTLSADHFISKRSSTGLKTVLAGLPWFSDWGRDTMIALCGLTLSTGRFEDAKEILLSFSKYIHKGLLPNVFPDLGSQPMYNSVDASLWYFQAIKQYYDHTKDKDLIQTLFPHLLDMLAWFMKGTDFSIYMDTDHLIHAGSGLDQVTWMDVRINGVCVTPRHGKPVEINALWYNALMVTCEFADLLNLDKKVAEKDLVELAQQVKNSFNEKFWNPETKCLLDVVEPNDPSIRPNQTYAVSLAYTMLPAHKEKELVDTCFKELYTSYGMRSLSRNHQDYKPIYTGPLIKRDYAYHQGTVWGFLIGSFISAYHKVYPNVSKESLYQRFVEPVTNHLSDGCIGGYSEIFDGDTPHHQRGCYTQAWSVAEILRVIKELKM